MLDTRKIVWLVLLACLILILWWAFDHVLFPDLPMPAGVAPVAK